MREQAGSENNRQEKARGEEMVPDLWVKVQVAEQERNRDQRIPALLCSAVPRQQSRQQEALPCPGKQRPVHTCKDTMHTCTQSTPTCSLTSAMERGLECQA